MESILLSEIYKKPILPQFGLYIKRYKDGSIYAKLPIVLFSTELDEGKTVRHIDRISGKEEVICDVEPFLIVDNIYEKNKPSLLSIYEFCIEEEI